MHPRLTSKSRQSKGVLRWKTCQTEHHAVAAIPPGTYMIELAYDFTGKGIVKLLSNMGDVLSKKNLWNTLSESMLQRASKLTLNHCDGLYQHEEPLNATIHLHLQRPILLNHVAYLCCQWDVDAHRENGTYSTRSP